MTHKPAKYISNLEFRIVAIHTNSNNYRKRKSKVCINIFAKIKQYPYYDSKKKTIHVVY